MIHREDRGGVAILRMQHGKANAVDIDLFDDLNRALDEVESSTAEALVLTGTGSIFSAGVNLFKVLEEGAPYLERFLPLLSTSVRRLFTLSMPAVAAVNGHAIAGGCILAAACDRRVMARGRGKIGVSELRVGVPFPADALETLRFLLPDRTVQKLVYSGRTLDADAAHAIGLVEDVATADEVLDRAVDAALDLSSLSGDAFAVTKQHIRSATVERMQHQAAELDPLVLEIWSRPDTLEGIRSFLEQTVGKK
ncbi:MAG: enoyl-CoA hydratase/isomerase family protein [Acidobacteriota bacterium]